MSEAKPLLHVVLFEPDIPQNTGNIGRMCAFASCRLHLIHPLGFEISDKQLRRAGMDYWRRLDIHEHESFSDFERSPLGPKRLFLLSTHAKKVYWDAEFKRGDGLIFGRESAGAPEWMHAREDIQTITIPQFGTELRSLNLSTAAGIATYEALRQIKL